MRPIPQRTFGESELAAARAVLARQDGDIRVAFVSGSLAAGLGHPLSDIDLYVVRDADPVSPSSVPVDGHVVQVTSMSLADLDRTVRICSSYQITPSERWQQELDQRSLTLAVRFAISTVLHAGVELPDRQTRRRVLRQVLVSRAGALIASWAEDVKGARELDDLGTELVTSRIALVCALEATLAAADDLYLGEKFLARRLLRTAATADLVPYVWDLLRDPAWPPDPVASRRLVDVRLRLASRLVTVAGLDGWDSPLALVTVPPEPGDSAGGPRRSVWHCPIRYGSAWGIAGPDSGFRVTEGAVRLWLALDGAPAEQVWQRLRAEVAGFADLSRESFDAGLARLTASGVAG
jgi:hypothetical protein